MRYSVALHTDDGKCFGATAPDIPGCFSAGASEDEALENVREAILGHLELLVEDGEEVPSALPVSEYEHRPEFQGVTWRVVEVNLISSGSSISPEKVWFDEDNLWVLLADGRTIGAPLVWFPRLLQSDSYSREQFELTAHGIHWSSLDEDISVQGLLNGYQKHDPELRALSDHAAGNVEEWNDPTEDGVWHE
ncbi:MAG: type II toxin-antitoxin system HicB family antitoxin [Marinobacter sp.]|nr:type II toxin-antitoxin system HicB family antitoxin [Marinobacter sp.]